MSLPSILYPQNMSSERRKSFEKMAEALEIPHERIVYGSPRMVHPTFCRAIIGDGRHLLVVTGVRTAPAYHLVLIDSSWAKPCSSPLNKSGLTPDLDEDRLDLLREVLVETCGDGDLWHEENGDAATPPHGLFHAEMGFTFGIDLVPDELING